MESKIFAEKGKIYMTGIGGISMSALAKYLHSKGYTVEGSDITPNEETALLEKSGITVHIGHFPECVPGAQAVIYTDAVAKDDPELSEAAGLHIPLVSRAKFLDFVSSSFPKVVTVAGSHGKTSTTAMCAHIFCKAEEKFTAHIGGRDLCFDNFYAGGEDIFLTEACEYKKNLLSFSRISTAVWLNCDQDHLECYRDYDELKETFYTYVKGAERCIVNGQDENIRKPSEAITYGIGSGNYDYAAVSLKQSGGKYAFTVLEEGKELCRIRLRVAGYFHIYNALAAVAAAREQGIGAKAIASGLQSFTGVKRRFEYMGKIGKADIICDYAHHPTEIEKVVRLAKYVAKGELYIIFQPHTYSRTYLLMKEFVAVLSRTEHPIIYKTYAAREDYFAEGSAYALHKQIKNSLYAENIRELGSFISKKAKSGDVFLFLGAGDIYDIARCLLQEEKKKGKVRM